MKRPRRIALAVFAASLVTTAGWYALETRRGPHLVTGPLVQLVSPHSFTLVWNATRAEPITVRLIDTDGKVIRDTSVSPMSTSPESVATIGSRFECEITGLDAGRAYTYDIGPGLHRATVRTAPDTSAPIRILAFGDSGDGDYPQWRVARLMPAWQPDLIVHTGDLVYDDGLLADYPGHFYRPYASLIDHIPFYPCLGNHDFRTDSGRPLLDTFVLPRNAPSPELEERNYWFDHAGVRFVALDSNVNRLSDLLDAWLDRVLADAGDRWKILFWHEPIFTHGKYEESAKLMERIVPILDRRHAHLVLSGHNHMYERTHAMRHGQVAAPGEGTVYVTTGAGGGNLYTLRPDPPPYLAASDNTQHGFTIIDVSDDLLRIRQIGEKSGVLDQFFIPRGGASTTTAPASRPAVASRPSHS